MELLLLIVKVRNLEAWKMNLTENQSNGRHPQDESDA
jgi:hypothetical protein